MFFLTDLNPNTIPHLIRKSESKLIDHLTILKDHDILSCLLDLEITDEEMYCLCQDYRDLLINKDQIQEKYNQDKEFSNRLFGVLTDIYVDWFKLKGLDVKQKIPTLLEHLDKYDFKDLMEFFEIDAEALK